MRSRLVLLWTPFVMAAALALASPTAATFGVTFTRVTNYCYGGQHQDVYFRVRITAAGSTAANKLTIDSYSQYFSAGKWHKYFVFPQDKDTFTADGTSHSADYSYTHEGTNQYNWRIVSKLRAWNGTQKLASKTLKSLAC